MFLEFEKPYIANSFNSEHKNETKITEIFVFDFFSFAVSFRLPARAGACDLFNFGSSVPCDF
jgi:hypothetical protein